MFEIIDNILVKYEGNEEDVVIPDGVIKIGEGAFANTKISSVTIPDSVKSIGEEAFMNCNHLGKVTMPDDIKVSENAFENTLFSRVNYNMGRCRYCGGELTGFFVKECLRCKRKQPIF